MDPQDGANDFDLFLGEFVGKVDWDLHSTKHLLGILASERSMPLNHFE